MSKSDLIKCLVCGKEISCFGSKGRLRKICSNHCTAIYMGKKNKNKPKSKEHIEKMVRRRRFLGEAQCIFCGDTFLKYHSNQVCCSKRECRRKLQRKRYYELKEKNPYRFLAKKMTGNLRLKGKTDIIENMLREADGKPCSYCGTTLSLENFSLDHKVPRKFSKVYNYDTKKKVYSDKVLRMLDSPSNLQIICKKCNQLKSDFNDKEFRLLLDFLKNYPEIKEKLFRRLMTGRVAYKWFLFKDKKRI